MPQSNHTLWLVQVLIEEWLASLVRQQDYGPFALHCFTDLIQAGLLPEEMHWPMAEAVRMPAPRRALFGYEACAVGLLHCMPVGGSAQCA